MKREANGSGSKVMSPVRFHRLGVRSDQTSLQDLLTAHTTQRGSARTSPAGKLTTSPALTLTGGSESSSGVMVTAVEHEREIKRDMSAASGTVATGFEGPTAAPPFMKYADSSSLYSRGKVDTLTFQVPHELLILSSSSADGWLTLIGPADIERCCVRATWPNEIGSDAEPECMWGGSTSPNIATGNSVILRT